MHMAAKSGKTLKLVSKRLKITKRGKIFRRFGQLGHAKAKEPAGVTRRKRKLTEATGHPLIQRAVKRMYYSR